MCTTRWILLFLTTTCFVTFCESYFLTGNNNTLARFKRQSGCKINEHQCGSGECISEDLICDGTENCRDGSDESSCSNFPCQSYLFKCTYGACINSDLRCNKQKDCKDNSDEANCSTGSTAEPSNTCGLDRYTCDNGQCIDDFDLCDGKADCQDTSDESVKACGSHKCPKFAYKCDYGACINKDLKCNGKKDCNDGSDEKNCNGNTVVTSPTTETTIGWTPTPSGSPNPVTNATPSEPGSCQLPPEMPNGKWQIYGASGNFKPGDNVKKETILMFKCNTQYGLYPNISLLFCNNGWGTIPKCLKTCSSIPSTTVMSATCTLDGSKVDCDKPYQGTRALLACNALYEDPTLERNAYRYCDDGSWDYPLPNCEPVCGIKSVEGQQLVIGGKNASKGEYPWQVGIYQADDNQHICGASMITPLITLSAAHCFRSRDPTNYVLAAGKYYRTYKDARDEEAQYSNIKNLVINEDYNDDFFAFDIAILVLETPFKITRFVLPVCMEYNPQFDLSTLINEKGIVTGWGYTQSDSKPSEVLKVLEVDYKTKSMCKLPTDFLTYYIPYAPDKMCAGLLNKGESACQGDSGGGLVFPKGNRYFIRGIVSVAPRKKSGGCDESQLTLFTSVKYHIEFIQNVIDKNKKARTT